MIRIVLLEDEELVRSGIRMILESSDTIRVVADDSDGKNVVDLVSRHRPDVVVTDIRMPAVDGLEVTRRVRELSSAPPVVVLTTFNLDEYVYSALQAGASGFLLKDTPPHDLVRGIEAVAKGDAILAPSVTRNLLAHFAGGTGARQAEARNKISLLTDREREVALAVATGASNADIARSLLMSESTVKVHIRSAMTKMDLDNRTQVAVIVHQAGQA